MHVGISVHHSGPKVFVTIIYYYTEVPLYLIVSLDIFDQPQQ